MGNTTDARVRRIVAALLIFCGALAAAVSLSAMAEDAPATPAPTGLDLGYSDLYNLDFAGAQKSFQLWETLHPDDPVGPASESAGFLFSEFNRLGVLEAQFFADDDAWLSRSKLTPDPAVRTQFLSAIGRAETLANARLAKDPRDRDGLFALTLAYGLQADYAALIEKRNIGSLRLTKQASAYAQQLLAVCNDCYDALLATGFSKYIIGSLSAPFRWLLRMGGMPGDKDGGLADLQTTAAHGHYLAPFARILLAIAYVREKDKPRALQLLNGLHTEFPANTLFPHEIARLQSGH
jgi:hypothetical protein